MNEGSFAVAPRGAPSLSSTQSGSSTVLILAPVGKDAATVQGLLAQRGLHGVICDDLAGLAARIDDDAGAVLITEEALLRADPAPLITALQAQPDWSDLPFMFLFSRRNASGPRVAAAGERLLGQRLPARVTNVMLLERPLGAESLLSAVEWALASRRRQILIRDQIAAQSLQAALLRQNEDKLEESRAYLRDVLDSTQEGFYALDRDGRVTVCNAAFRRMLGFSTEAEIIGARLHAVIHHSHADGSPYADEDCPIHRAAREGTPCHVTSEYFYRLDGSRFPVDYRAQPIHRHGQLVGAVCTFSDLTATLRQQHDLRAANERFALALNSGAVLGSWSWDVASDCLTGDRRFAQLFSLDADRLIRGMPIAKTVTMIHPGDLPRLSKAIKAAIRQGGSYRAEYRIRVGEAGWHWVEASGQVSAASGAEAKRVTGVIIDISELKRIEEALRASDRELRLIADSLPYMIGYVDRDQIYRFANMAYLDWFYLHPSEVVGRHVREIVGEEGLALRAPALQRAMQGESASLELSWPHRDGRRREAEIRYLPRIDETGAVAGVHIFVLDVTDRTIAAETLRGAADALERRVAERTAALTAEIAERKRAEDALRQSQKMEAVGQLTGGIAHDFNNMLTGIIGSIDLMQRRIASGRIQGLERFMDAASASANRAAALTHRLLAFSRRQSLDSRPIDVNGLVASLADLLERTIGEQVVLRVQLCTDLAPAQADQNQLENAVINLAINARDAMPQGGELLIETSCLDHVPDTQPAASDPGLLGGRYVALSVTDTGFGMPPDVLSRAFEPFYTTKPLGQGTGLGLSMIYGFAQQSGGGVRIRSAPGEGTTVRLYLPVAPVTPLLAPALLVPALFVPAVSEPAVSEPGLVKPGAGPARGEDLVQARARRQGADASPRGAGETVLLVEDDPAVRLLVLEVLGELGYLAIEAADGMQAIPILESGRRIDLLVTDVGLPGINGRQLAEIARQSRPGLRVLFMTGYAEKAASRAGFLDEGMQLITKPFPLQALARQVRAMIEE